MKVQRIRLRENHYSWLVLGKNHLPIKPIQEFIRYLDDTEKSPNTVRSYANHLKLFWEFLEKNNQDWHDITIDHLSRFIHWLRSYHAHVITLTSTPKRTETTVNCIITCLSSFYRYHQQLGHTNVEMTEPVYGRGRYQSFLHHIHKRRPIHKKVVRLKSMKTLPKTLSETQLKAAFKACVNVRDQFLLRLLYETGLRVGQALGLQHQDIQSWDNLIQVIPRKDNMNGARTKSRSPYIVHVSTALMQLYSDYINTFRVDTPSHPYVLINLATFEPLHYGAVRQLFLRLAHKVGFPITPHMFRHTHATELIRQGWEAAFVQKRLGHASIQTTLDIYSHLDTNDLKTAYDKFVTTRNTKNENH